MRAARGDSCFFDEDLGQLVRLSAQQKPDSRANLKTVPIFSREYCSVMCSILENWDGTPAEFIEEVLLPELREVGSQTLRKYSDLLLTARKPKLMIEVLRWKTGASLMNEGRSISQIARDHGVRKQAIQQASDSLDVILPGFRSITRRSDQARRKMSLRNARRGATCR